MADISKTNINLNLTKSTYEEGDLEIVNDTMDDIQNLRNHLQKSTTHALAPKNLNTSQSQQTLLNNNSVVSRNLTNCSSLPTIERS